MENLYKLEQELALLSDSEILLKFTEDSIRIEKSNMSDFKIKVQKDAISKFLKSWRDVGEKEIITVVINGPFSDFSKEKFLFSIGTIDVLKENGKIELTDEEEKTLDILKKIADEEIEKDEIFKDEFFYNTAITYSYYSAIAKESQEECLIKTEALLERITDKDYLEKFKNEGVETLEQGLLQIEGDDETKMKAINFLDYVMNNFNFDRTLIHNGLDTPEQ